MQGRIIYQFIILFLYVFVTITAYRQHPQKTENPSRLLTRLLSSQSSKPVVLFVNLGGSKPRSSDFDNLFNAEGDGNDGLVDDDYDDNFDRRDRTEDRDDGYYLYHLLRNALADRDDEDDRNGDEDSSSSGSSLESTKLMLRSALRARCRKVDKCVKKCPPKKPSCPMNCQEVFDDLNLCPPPPPKKKQCKKPKCGKTMPPRWRF